MKIFIIILSILIFSSFSFAEEPCDEKAFRIKYNQERLSEIEQELVEIRGWQSCLANERAKLLQRNQQLRQLEPEEKTNESP